MAAYHVLRIDSLIESLTLCNAGEGFLFQLDTSSEIFVQPEDLILGLLSPINEIRYIFCVESASGNSLSLKKRFESSDGVVFDFSVIPELQPNAYEKELFTIDEKLFNSLVSRLCCFSKSNSTVTSNKYTGPTIQKILYGCPGTGKSHKINKEYAGIDGELATYFDENGNKIDMPDTKEERMSTPSNIFRTTFHPDYDYSNFVGSYKPVMRKSDDVSSGDEEKRELEYAFVPQVFTKAYMRAYKSKNDDSLSASAKQVYLIIEEINRGNCAQIFGDLFQLLDRKDGVSEYPVVPDTELINYLNEHGIPGNSLRLPANLHILATMNTSDQSLFPMDSAFKRRWAMEYIPINLKQEKAKTFTFKVKGVDYSWVEFLAKVNPLIRKATDSEDKQMGEFFIKESVSEEDFKNKVIFYIWNDVCKDLYSASRISPLFFMRSADGDDRKDVFTFAELFGSGRYNEEANDYTLPSDLLEGFIKNYLKLTPKTDTAPDAE